METVLDVKKLRNAKHTWEFRPTEPIQRRGRV